MKVRLIWKSIVIGCMVFSPIAFGDDWAEYQQLMNRYYTFDPQSFKSISCKVIVPELLEEVKKLRQANEQYNDSYRIEDTLDTYSVTVTSAGDIKIVRPVIVATNTFGKHNEATIDSFFSRENEYFRAKLDTIDYDIKGMLHEYKPPDPTEIHIQSIQNVGGVMTVNLAIPDREYSDVSRFSGDEVEVQLKQDVHVGGRQFTVSGSQMKHYGLKVGDKLLISEIDQQGAQSGRLFSIKMKFTYQLLNGVQFPKQLATESQDQSFQPNQTFNIIFDDCRVVE